VTIAVPLTLIASAWLVGIGASPSLQAEITLILCNLIVVLGLQLFIGNSGVYSFGHIAFASLGAYAAALLTLPPIFASLQTPGLPTFIADAQLSPLADVAVVATLTGLFAAIVGVPLMRTSTLAIPISTFAFLIVVYNVLANWDQMTAGSSGLVSIPRTTGVGTASLAAGLAALVALIFKFSAIGYRLQASRDDEVAARSIGVHVTRERLIAFALSAALCGVGAALAVHESGVLTPSSFYFGATVTTLTMLVLGGSRSVLGAVLGTLAVGTVNEALRGFEEGAHLFGLISIGATPGLSAIGLGLILLVTIAVLPEGLTGGREAGEFAHLRRAGRNERLPAAKNVARSRQRVGGELRATGVSVAFSGLEVLRAVDLSLGTGEILGLIGPNGAGKTTLVNILSGFQRADAGAVALDGAAITSLSPAARARAGLARTFQNSLPFTHLTALEAVAAGAMGVGRSKRRSVQLAHAILDGLGLGEVAGCASGSLPPGPQRLLGIGRALATEPRYLLLDEPAAGLSEAEGDELIAILNAVREDFGCGLLLIEHDMNVVMDLCPRVQVLEEGRTLTVGPPAEVRSDPAVLECYLGTSYLAAAGA
jgi:branched-chain amino acid transport system permease protein